MPEYSGTESLREADGIASLVERAAKGDRHAFNEIIGKFQEDIFRMVYFRTGSRMDAEDLTQEVFMKTYEGLASLKDSSLFRPWLYRVAVNRVHDYHRRKRVRSFFLFFGDREDVGDADDLRHPEPGALDLMVHNEFRKAMKAFLERLSSMERDVFQLRFMEQLGIAEIGRVLDKNESTVKTHLYRAVKKAQAEPRLLEIIRGKP